MDMNVAPGSGAASVPELAMAMALAHMYACYASSLLGMNPGEWHFRVVYPTVVGPSSSPPAERRRQN